MKKIVSFLKTFLKNVIGSLDHSQDGFSQKKLIAYTFVFMIIFIHVCLWKYQFSLGNFSNLDYVLASDLTFLAAALGLNYMHEKNITTSDSEGSAVSQTEVDTTKKDS